MKIAFLDRDGVINQYPGDRYYVTKVKDLHILPQALEGLKMLKENGYTVFVISNQAGVSKGIYSLDKLQRINRQMIEAVEKGGGKIKKVFYCTHRLEENCDCRKPKIGSIKKAFELMKKPIKQASSAYFVGDAQTDIEAGHKAGCKTIFVLSGKETKKTMARWKVKPDYVAKDLKEAARIMIQ